MLEPLAGRLKWERTPVGIQVAIPARRGSGAAVYGPLIGVWLIIAAVHYWSLVGGNAEEGESTLHVVAILGYVVGFVFLICWVLWAFTSETVVTVDAGEVRIQRRIVGIDLFTRSFPTSQVEQIRYVAPTHAMTNQSITDPNSSKVEFHAQGRVHYFAQGVTEAEARAMIVQMLEVYTFPRSAYLQAPHLHGDW
jgi:hypothetical protein